MKTFLRRGLLAFVGQGSQAASSFLLTVVVSRAVSPAVRGEFVLLTLIPQLGTYLVTLGLPGALLRAAASDRRRRPQILAASGVAALLAGLIITAATPLLLSSATGDNPPLPVLLLGSSSLAWLIFAAYFAFGLDQFLVAGLLRTLPVLGATVIIVALGAIGSSDLTLLYLPWALCHLIVAIGSAAYYFRSFGLALPAKAEVIGWLQYGLRYSIIEILNLASLRADQLLLGWLSTTATLGVYSVSVSLSEGLLLVSTAVGLVIFIDSAKGTSGATFVRSLGVTAGVVSAAAVVLAILAKPVVHLLFGESYADAVTLTQILLLGTPGLVALRLVTNRVAGGGRPGQASLYMLVTVVATLGLDLLLIPSHGATGAAWAASASYDLGGAIALAMLLLR